MRPALLRRNLLSVKERLGRDDGLIWSKPLVPGLMGIDGHVPGYLLQNLTLIDHPDAEKAFNAIGEFAQCTGEIAEGHTAAKRGVMVLQYSAEQKSGDTTARYRPWEGGVVADAVLQYLIGEEWDAPGGHVSVTPHLPNGWGEMAARGLRCGAWTYAVEVRDSGARRRQRVTNRSQAPLIVDLGASVTGAAIGEVRVDGQPIPRPEIDAEFSRASFRVERTIAPGATVELEFDYAR